MCVRRRQAGVRFARLALLPAGLLLGCNDPRVATYSQRREASMRSVFQFAADREHRSPANLRRTFEMIDARNRQDVAAFPRSIDGVGQQLEFEVQRWKDRSGPYMQAVEAELRGNPRHAADTIPDLLY